MRKVPLSDEIRALRAEVLEGRQAQVHAQRVAAALQSLGMAKFQQARRPELAVEVPGDDLLSEIAARWGIPTDDAGAANPLLARMALLQQVEKHLWSKAGGLATNQARLLELEEQQRRILANGEWGPVIAELKQIGAEWERHASELEPLLRHQAVLTPMLAQLSSQLSVLRQALNAATDPLGRQAFLTAHQARGLYDSLTGVLSSVGVEAPECPALSALPAPGPEHVHAIRQHADAQVATLDSLEQTLVRELNRSLQALEGCQERCDLAQQQMRAITG